MSTVLHKRFIVAADAITLELNVIADANANAANFLKVFLILFSPFLFEYSFLVVPP